MASSARGGYLGKATGRAVERDPAVGIEKLDRRVLCMGFQSISAAQYACKWLKVCFSLFKCLRIFSPSSEGDCTEGELDVRSYRW
jgi:hypothetical protein